MEAFVDKFRHLYPQIPEEFYGRFALMDRGTSIHVATATGTSTNGPTKPSQLAPTGAQIDNGIAAAGWPVSVSGNQVQSRLVHDEKNLSAPNLVSSKILLSFARTMA